MKYRIIGILLALSLLVSCSPNYESTDNNLSSPISTEIIEQQSTPVPAIMPSVTNAPTSGKGVSNTKSNVYDKSVSVPDTKEANISDNSNTTNTEKKEITVYVTRTGAKYHSAGCSYLRKSCIPMSLSDARASGYTPCSRCHPPR